MPACEAFEAALNTCAGLAGVHHVAHSTVCALCDGGAPRAFTGMAVSPVSLTASQAAEAGLRHVLGVVDRPDTTKGLAAAMRLSRPVLLAVVDMARAMEHASARQIAATAVRCRQHGAMRFAFGCVRAAATWRPAKRPLMPLAQVLKRSRRVREDVVGPPPVLAPMLASPQDAVASVRAAWRRGPEATAAVNAQLRRVATAGVARAVDSEAVAAIIRDAAPSRAEVSQQLGRVFRGADPVTTDRRQRAREWETAGDEVRRARLRAAPAADLVDWWVDFQATCAARAGKAARRRAQQEPAMAAALASVAPLTSAQRAAAQVASARRQQEEDAAAERLRFARQRLAVRAALAEAARVSAAARRATVRVRARDDAAQALARARRVLHEARVRGVWLHRVGGVGRGVLGQRARVLARRVGGGVTLQSGGVSR